MTIRRVRPRTAALRRPLVLLVVAIGICLAPPGHASAESLGGDSSQGFLPAKASDDHPLGTADRVLIFSVPTLTWEDLQKYDVPNLRGLLEDSVVGDLSVRSVTRHTDAVDGYATLNAGTRTEGTRQGSLAFVAGLNRGTSDHSGDPADVPSGAYDTEPPEEDLPSQPVPAPVDPDSGTPAGDDPTGTDNAIDPGSVESYNGSPAAEEFARRTGVLPPVGSVFNFGIVSMRSLNSRLLFDAEVGALGDALEGAGVRRAVIANGDHGRGSEDTEYRREGSIALMGGDGLVPRGRVSPKLLRQDPLAPFGTRYDNAVVAEAFAEFWYSRSAVLVEASDMVRYEAVAPLVLDAQREAFRRQAIENSDELLGMLLEQVDMRRDAVVVVAPYASGETTDLTVVGFAAPGVERGLISSGTTRRSGFAQTVDIAPSVLSLFDAEVPSSMEGTVVERGAGGGSFGERSDMLVEAAEGAVFRDRTLGGASVMFVLSQVVLWLVAIWTLMRPGRSLRTMAEIATLATLTFMPMTFLAGAFPAYRWGMWSWWAIVSVGSLALAVAIHFSTRRHLVDPLMVTLGFVVAFLSVDIIFGGPLQFNTVFGYSPTIAGRFNGLGNPAFSMLTASGIILAALVAHRVQGRRGIHCAVGVLAWCVVLDGAPMLGADVGGALTLAPAAGVTAWMLLGWRIRARTVIVGAFVTLVLVLGFGLLDLTRPAAEQTHLGRLLSDVGANGVGAFETVVLRKLNANLSVLTSSIWTLMLPVVIAAVAFVIWWAPWRLRTIAERIPEERAAVAGLITAMVLGFALNDSGITVPGIMLVVVNAALVNLLLRVDEELPSRSSISGPKRDRGRDGVDAPTDEGVRTDQVGSRA